MGWQKLFLSHIKNRGLNYYLERLVEDFIDDGTSIKALVQGSEPYNVLIEYNNGEILSMSCECPYAEDGNNCKHMAAVLFYSDNKKGKVLPKCSMKTSQNTKVNKQTNNTANIAKLVEQAEEKKVRQFLASVLQQDERLFMRFKLAVYEEMAAQDLSSYKKQIKNIFKQYAGRQNFIDYHNACYFIGELDGFLDQEVRIFLNNHRFKEVFALTSYLFLEIGRQDMDDSDGGTRLIVENCMAMWREILAKCDEKMQHTMFNWYVKQLDSSLLDYMEACVEQMLFENFWEPEFLDAKLALCQNKLCAYKKAANSWLRSYQLEKWIMHYIKCMQAKQMPKELIISYCKENLEFSAIRKYYVEQCLASKDYATAMAILEEGKEKDCASAGLVAEYSVQLKDLYKYTRNIPAYEKELWLQMLQYKPGDLKVFKELKALYIQKEWEIKREHIFEKLPARADLNRLYIEEQLYEQLYERLLNSILKGEDIYKLMTYEKYLKALYPDDLLDKYAQLIDVKAKNASDRKQYRELVRVLKIMKGYPGGSEKINTIVNNWRMLYKNRPAMLDELNKL